LLFNDWTRYFEISKDFFEVQKLLKTRRSEKNQQYLVKWKTNSKELFEDQWTNKDDITDNLIEIYHRTYTLCGVERVLQEAKETRNTQ
jgi:Chromo (CHRromatin Organisation MOdifier) domain